MKKSKADIIADVRAFIGDNTSDEALNLIENISDSIDEENNELQQENDNLRQENETLRKKYIDRFSNRDEEDNDDNNDFTGNNSNDKKLTFENLFEEG